MILVPRILFVCLFVLVYLKTLPGLRRVYRVEWEDSCK
jgi:hypothetical protein